MRRPYVLRILDASLFRSCAREDEGRVVFVFRSGEEPFSKDDEIAGRGCDMLDGLLLLSVAIS